jgi:choline transport protein
MSYVSVVCTGLVGFVIVLWFTTKKKTFKGPIIDYDLLNERRMAAISGGVIITEGEAREDNLSTKSVSGVIKAVEY